MSGPRGPGAPGVLLPVKLRLRDERQAKRDLGSGSCNETRMADVEHLWRNSMWLHRLELGGFRASV